MTEAEDANDDEQQQRISFRDPQLLTEVPELFANVLPHPALAFVIKSEWHYIRSYMVRITKNMIQYNLRWATPTRPRLRQYLEGIFGRSRTPFFIIAMGGYYLAINDAEASLFYAEENTQIFENPTLIRTRADLEQYIAEWPRTATIIRNFKKYFNTKVKVLGMANVLFLVVTPNTGQPALLPSRFFLAEQDKSLSDNESNTREQRPVTGFGVLCCLLQAQPTMEKDMHASAPKRTPCDEDSTPPNDDELSCPTCAAQFRSRVALRLHRKYHHPQPRARFRCRDCSRSFRRKLSLMAHTRKIHGYAFVCRLCQAKLSSLRDFTAHTSFHRKADAQPKRQDLA